MSNKTIFDALRAAGLTAEGACGLMGNMMAESTMKSNIAQRGMTKLSDEQYTAAADNGLIDFVRDSVGYGLCQWTASDRKAKLLAYAQNRGVSVGDEAMQVQFCLLELTAGWQKVGMILRSSCDIDECADRVCDQYEIPAVKNYTTRRQFAREFFNQFCGSDALAQETAAQPEKQGLLSSIGSWFRPAAQEPAKTGAKDNAGITAAVMIFQMFMSYTGYWGEVDGQRSPEFFSALRKFVDDLEKQ